MSLWLSSQRKLGKENSLLSLSLTSHRARDATTKIRTSLFLYLCCALFFEREEQTEVHEGGEMEERERERARRTVVRPFSVFS